MSDRVKKHRALKNYMDNRSHPPNTPSLLIDNDHDHNNLSSETIVNSVVNKENNYGAFVSDNESSFNDCVDDSNQSIYPAESEVIISNETDTDNSDSNNQSIAEENAVNPDTIREKLRLSKEYIELKFTEMSKKLDKMKFSLLYEIQKQGGNIKTQVIMNSASILTYGEKDVNTCIRKTLSEVITPEVQQFYSGAGRMIRGEGKLNFNATKTYVCLSDIIQKKFGDSDQTKNLRSSVGSFLANFGDRDGSKRKRA
ncbi:hypothetical protein KQX54_014514 [Cotesia glomerata]|uniref:DUF4806 domain-containing protein n=1 Tax=Cotesia glomerata TaxID=32391 RepID=A0AAV7IVI1_COTGL|nr:hypothetical protein KQX54_014514 [Cotesia glomerata]